MHLRSIFCALLVVATPVSAAAFTEDPSIVGQRANEWFASRSMTSRFSEAKCREGAQLKSCVFAFGPIEIIAQGAPSSGTISKITVSVGSGSGNDAALFMIASVAIIALYAPGVSQEMASKELADMVKGAAAEGKQSTTLEQTYLSVMKVGTDFIFTAMPD